MEKATPFHAHAALDLEALAAAIEAAVAAWPADCLCAFCSAAAPTRAAVLFSPSAQLVFVAPACSICAVSPEALRQPAFTWEN